MVVLFDDDEKIVCDQDTRSISCYGLLNMTIEFLEPRITISFNVFFFFFFFYTLFNSSVIFYLYIKVAFDPMS